MSIHCMTLHQCHRHLIPLCARIIPSIQSTNTILYSTQQHNLHTSSIHHAKARKIQDTVAPPKRFPYTVNDINLQQSMMPNVIDQLKLMNVSDDNISYINKMTSLSTGNNHDLQHAKLQLYHTRYQLHTRDSGNVSIQAAALIERIENMRRHLRDRNTDIFARRTMAQLIGKRRKLLLYMRKHHWVQYRQVMIDFGLNEVELFSYGVTSKSGQQAQRQKLKH